LGQQAFTMIAQSGGGKSVICSGLVKTALENGYNNITYITKSYDSDMNVYMRNYVSRFLVYEPTDARDFVLYVHKLVECLGEEMAAAV